MQLSERIWEWLGLAFDESQSITHKELLLHSLTEVYSHGHEKWPNPLLFRFLLNISKISVSIADMKTSEEFSFLWSAVLKFQGSLTHFSIDFLTKINSAMWGMTSAYPVLICLQPVIIGAFGDIRRFNREFSLRIHSQNDLIRKRSEVADKMKKTLNQCKTI